MKRYSVWFSFHFVLSFRAGLPEKFMRP